jgi:hypothetical protein
VKNNKKIKEKIYKKKEAVFTFETALNNSVS